MHTTTANVDTKTQTPDAFDELVNEHLTALVRAARRLCAGRPEAEDLVQDTLLKAYRSFHKLEPSSRLRPWLLRIMHNTYVSHWRRLKRERELLVGGAWQARAPWLEPEPLRGDDPEEPAETLLSAEVTRALGELPDHYRTCVVLVDVHDRSYKEAAQIIGSPVGTIMSRLHRGRRMLRGKLYEYATSEGVLAAA